MQRLLKRLPLLASLLFHSWRVFQPKVTMGAVGVVFRDDRRVLLVEHTFHPKTPWGLPGGWVARGENPADTVSRELMEEVSLAVDVGPIILVELPFRNHLDLAYLCRTRAKIGTLSYEILDATWFACDELPRLLPFHNLAIQRAGQMLEIREYRTWIQP
jgi:8-oxo-dGTP diphosphatase